MTYQIDKETLKKIVKECIDKRLKTKKDLNVIIENVIKKNKKFMFEMAFPRKIYMSKIDGIAPQIIENICLIRHCVICNQTAYKTHWMKELKGFMETVMRCDIKNSKGWETKESAIRQVCEYNDFFIPEKIEWVIRTKFKEEGFDVTDATFLQVISDCINTFNTLIHILSSGTYEEIDDFIEKISK